MSNKNAGRFEAGQVKRALLPGMPKGEGFETHIGMLDKAVADFCKKADMPIPGVNTHPKDQVDVPDPASLLGKDTSTGEGFDAPAVDERPGGLDAEGTDGP